PFGADRHGSKLHGLQRLGEMPANASGPDEARSCHCSPKLKLVGLYRDVNAPFALGRELDTALAEREQRVIGAHADTIARMPLGAALAHDDIAGDDALAAGLLHAEAAPGRVAAVTG